MELCIVHANCQGEPLVERLMACPEFAARYECLVYTNYIREPIPDEKLKQCSLFLYQHLGKDWDDLGSDVLLGKLPKTAGSLSVPSMFFKGYWPLWNGKSGFDYRCSHLDSLIDKGLPPEETIVLFLHSNVAAWYDLPALMEKTVETEYNRERRTPIKYVDVLLENHTRHPLFNTINHPGSMLMNHISKEILINLGYTPPTDAELDRIKEPFPEFEQPINPKISQFFGWEFGDAETQYNIYGRKMTFARYVANYVVARRAGVTDFIGFLQGNNIAI
jgi:hypothetical protein